MKVFLFGRFGIAAGLLIFLTAAGCNILGPVGGVIGQAIPVMVALPVFVNATVRAAL